MFLTALPDDIGNLVNLEKLFANGNCFSALPDSFGKLQALNDLGLYGVPWLQVPKGKKVSTSHCVGFFLEGGLLFSNSKYYFIHVQIFL